MHKSKLSLTLISTIISILLAYTSVEAGRRSNCLGNKACSNLFYILPEYHKDTPSVDKKMFTKEVNKLDSFGVIIYAVGDSYKILIPNSTLFKRESDNLSKTGHEILKSLDIYLQNYKTTNINIQSLYIDDGHRTNSKPELQIEDVAAKQAEVFSGEIYKARKKSGVRGFQFSTATKINYSSSMPFYRKSSKKGIKLKSGLYILIEYNLID